jgi:M6 family metalloprotease-like protein
MRSISIFIAFLIILLIPLASVNAVPATPFPITITQPDGSVLTIRLHGDEYFNYKTTLDSYPLVSDTNGILTYAQINANGQLVSTSVKATDIDKRSTVEKTFIKTLSTNINFSNLRQQGLALRSKKSITETTFLRGYPLTGTPKSLVILVNFKDLSFVTSNPKVAFTNLLNQKGYSTNGGTGSATDYFHDSSTGVFSPQFDVVGPFNLPQNMAYYGGNDASGNDINPRQMVIDACTLAAASGVDFSQYDTDHNGVVDNVFIYYAGYNEAEGGPANSIWPHRWTLADLTTIFNGVSVYDYACTSELRSNTGANMCGIGTFCHEFGHVLGLPDYYVTNGATDHHTLSEWNIMDYGPYLNNGRTPPSYCAWDRFYLNWLTPTEIKVAGAYTRDTLITSNKAYLISQYGNFNMNSTSPSPLEFFMLENRQQKGWDAYLPGHGMLVYHIFYDPDTWESNTVNNDPNAMGVDIVEADGIALTETTSIDPTLSGDPFPGTSKVTSFSPLLRDGTNIHKPLVNIQEINGIIQFHFASKIALTQNLQPFSTVQGTPSAVQSVTVSGTELNGAINIAFKTGQHFEMKIDTAKVWEKTITLYPVDSVVGNTNIQIRYNPTVPSYTNVQADTLLLTTNAGDYAEAAISGTSTRAVYVVPPIANDATDATFTSFLANWNSVYDATGYYLTVYNITDGESSITEGFDNGLVAPVDWTITAKNTTSSNIYSGTNPPSILFSNSGEFVETENYLLPITKLSFYIHSLGGSNGGFLVEAQNDQNSWVKVDSIPVTTTLYEKSKSYTFNETNGYDRLRFTYFKGIGSLTFDDVTVGFIKQLNYNLHESWITSTIDSITNLVPNTTYSYKVRASDKSIYYENITDFSNVISVNTLAYPSKNNLIATKNGNGDITVDLPTLGSTFYIYNVLGQCFKSIVADKTTIVVNGLPKNQVYILKFKNLVTKIAL